MKLIDLVLLCLILLVILLALHSILKHGGRECSGNCSGCSGCVKGKRGLDREAEPADGKTKKS